MCIHPRFDFAPPEDLSGWVVEESEIRGNGNSHADLKVMVTTAITRHA
jgi:hypothetical protein